VKASSHVPLFFPCGGVPKGWVYGSSLVFVSVRTNKRQHHQKSLRQKHGAACTARMQPARAQRIASQPVHRSSARASYPVHRSALHHIPCIASRASQRIASQTIRTPCSAPPAPITSPPRIAHRTRCTPRTCSSARPSQYFTLVYLVRGTNFSKIQFKYIALRFLPGGHVTHNLFSLPGLAS
jgi:hypothetical protein